MSYCPPNPPPLTFADAQTISRRLENVGLEINTLIHAWQACRNQAPLGRSAARREAVDAFKKASKTEKSFKFLSIGWIEEEDTDYLVLASEGISYAPQYNISIMLGLMVSEYIVRVRYGAHTVVYTLADTGPSFITVTAMHEVEGGGVHTNTWRAELTDGSDVDYNWMFLLPVPMRQTFTGFHSILPFTIPCGPADTWRLDAIKIFTMC